MAVQYERERSRLVTVDIESGTVTGLTEFAERTQWGPARWSPDGAWLAAIRFSRFTSLDLVLLSADGRVVRLLTDDRALEGVPEWDTKAPSGIQRLFFTSDRSGVRELYSLELEGDSLRTYLTARVATGIHDVTVVPTSSRSPPASDRTTIVATVAHADGRHLERLDISRDKWVTVPSPAANPTPRPADIALPPLSEKDTFPTRPYTPAGDLIPRGWSPVFATVEELGLFLGGATGSVDVIGRHSWRAAAAYGPDGRTAGIRKLRVSPLRARRDVRTVRLDLAARAAHRIQRRRVAASRTQAVRCVRRRRSVADVSHEPRPSSRASRSRIVIARTQVTSARCRAPIRFSRIPTLVGGGLGLRFGNVQAGLRSISVQDGVGMFAGIDYLKATEGDRWRSGWELGGSLYQSFPSWTTSGRPVLAATVRVAEQRGPAAGRLTAGGLGTSSILEAGGSDFEVRGYPPGFVAADAMWSARTEMRLPVARVSRGLGALPFYLRGFSSSWFVDSVGAASSADRLGSPQLVSTGAELSTDITLFSFVSVRIRTGVGVPLKSLGPVSSGDGRFYVTAGTSF